jgi:hypothetical protein
MSHHRQVIHIDSTQPMLQNSNLTEATWQIIHQLKTLLAECETARNIEINRTAR